MDVQQLQAEAYMITEVEKLEPVAVIVVARPGWPPVMLVETAGELWTMGLPLGDRRSLRELLRDLSAEDLAQRLQHPHFRVTFHALAHRLRVAQAIKDANAAGLLT